MHKWFGLHCKSGSLHNHRFTNSAVCQFSTVGLVKFNRNFHKHRFTNSAVYWSNMLWILPRLLVINSLDLQNTWMLALCTSVPGYALMQSEAEDYQNVSLALGKREEQAHFLVCNVRDFKCQLPLWGTSGGSQIFHYCCDKWRRRPTTSHIDGQFQREGVQRLWVLCKASTEP